MEFKAELIAVGNLPATVVRRKLGRWFVAVQTKEVNENSPSRGQQNLTATIYDGLFIGVFTLSV